MNEKELIDLKSLVIDLNDHSSVNLLSQTFNELKNNGYTSVTVNIKTSPEQELNKSQIDKLYYGIMAPGAIITVALGLWLWLGYGPWGYWFHAKSALALVLIAYHLYCGRLLKDFALDRNTKSHVWFRWFNEFPVLILFGAVWLVLFKPF